MTDGDLSHIADLADTPIAGVPLPPVSTWPPEGNVAIGVLSGISLSVPFWWGLIGAARAVLG